MNALISTNVTNAVVPYWQHSDNDGEMTPANMLLITLFLTAIATLTLALVVHKTCGSSINWNRFSLKNSVDKKELSALSEQTLAEAEEILAEQEEMGKEAKNSW